MIMINELSVVILPVIGRFHREEMSFPRGLRCDLSSVLAGVSVGGELE
jgi:hypothetical protein